MSIDECKNNVKDNLDKLAKYRYIKELACNEFGRPYRTESGGYVYNTVGHNNDIIAIHDALTAMFEYIEEVEKLARVAALG